MTEKLYGLDDIPEGWVLVMLTDHLEFGGEITYGCTLKRPLVSPMSDIVKTHGLQTPQLALHKAIQKAKGETL
jgi:hypothetical protein